MYNSWEGDLLEYVMLTLLVYKQRASQACMKVFILRPVRTVVKRTDGNCGLLAKSGDGTEIYKVGKFSR